MDVILTAGGFPKPGEPLYSETGGGCKALLELHGKTMIQWVLDALAGSPRVECVVVIGLPPGTPLDYPGPIYALDNQGSMLDNIIAGAKEVHRHNPESQHCILTASDVPCIQAEMVNWLADLVAAGEDELYYLVVERQVMERTFPGSRRTYVKLKGLEVCGGDVNAFTTRAALNPNPLWRELIENRKNPIRQASIIGFGPLLGLLLGNLDLHQAVKQVSQRIGLRGRAVICPFAEMAMDVDKPYQLELARSYLASVSG